MKYVSTRGHSAGQTFTDILLEGLCADGGHGDQRAGGQSVQNDAGDGHRAEFAVLGEQRPALRIVLAAHARPLERGPVVCHCRQLRLDDCALLLDHDHFLEAAQEAGDEVTADIMIKRMTIHEKNAWMLRASAQ